MKTPRARALIGCLALIESEPLGDALKLAGYTIRAALPVSFYRGRCYRSESARLVMRDGRIVFRSSSAGAVAAWMFRLGRKLAALPIGRTRTVRPTEVEARS